jgi:hypothetical protein
MTIDCTNLKPGDKVRLRNGSIDTVAENDGLNVPIRLEKHIAWYPPNGIHQGGASEYDIVEILTNPKPEMNTTAPQKVYGSVSIDYQNLGNPTKITINGIEYVRLDIVSPEVHYRSGSFAVVKSAEDETVRAIWHENKRFTPADSWPEPITDRQPTKEDANEDGDVQFLDSDGDWIRGPYTPKPKKRLHERPAGNNFNNKNVRRRRARIHRCNASALATGFIS